MFDRDLADLAWAAGLFEGEGCISRQHGSRQRNRLQLVSTDEDVIRRFVKIVGYGKVGGPYQQQQTKLDGSPKKPHFQWWCHKEVEVRLILEDFYPFLGNRRRQLAKELLANV